MKRTVFLSSSNFWPLVSPVASLELDPSCLLLYFLFLHLPSSQKTLMIQNNFPVPPTQPTRFLPKSPTGSGVATGSVGKTRCKDGRSSRRGQGSWHRGDRAAQDHLLTARGKGQPTPRRASRFSIKCPTTTIAANEERSPVPFAVWHDPISFWDRWKIPKPRDQLCTCPNSPHMCNSKIWLIMIYRLSDISSQLEPFLGFLFNSKQSKHSSRALISDNLNTNEHIFPESKNLDLSQYQ